MKRRILWLVVLSVLLIPALAFAGGDKEKTEGTAAAAAGSKVHSNIDEFTYIQEPGTKVDLTGYYER